jgi:hypothetical protein
MPLRPWASHRRLAWHGSQRKMDHMANDDAARPMIDWMNSVPPGDLAAELMPAFGGGGSLDGGTIVNRLFELQGWYPRSGFSSQNYPEEPGCQFLEAMQLLKHADLVYESRAVTWPRTHDVTYWRATRFGLVTLANGRAAVRQRIKDRTGL